MPYVWKRSLREQLEHYSCMNFTYVELGAIPFNGLWGRTLNRRKRTKLKELFDSYNLKLYSLCPSYIDLNFISVNPAIRKETVKQMKENIILAFDLEAKLIVLVPGRRFIAYAPPLEIDWNHAKKGITDVAKFAERYDVLLALEAIPAYGFIETSDNVRKIIQEIDSENLRACVDSANTSRVESPVAAIENLADILVHVHLSDCHTKTFEHLPIGMGELDFSKIAEALRKMNYRGLSMIEIFYLKNADKHIVESKKRLEELGWNCV